MVSNIPYAERPDLTYSFAAGGENSLVRVCEVEYANEIAFLRDMLGTATAAGGAISRQLPEVHPRFPRLYATRADFRRGEGVFSFDADEPPVNPGKFETSVIAITYSAADFDLKEDGVATDVSVPELSRYVRRERGFQVESLPLSRARFHFVDGNTPPAIIPEHSPKLFPSQELIYTWVKVPIPPGTLPGALPGTLESKISNYLGRVNSGTFDHARYFAETIMFVGCEPTRYWDFEGKEFVDLKYRFVLRDYGDTGGGVHAGHNHLWNQNAGGGAGAFQLVTTDGTGGGTKIHSSADLGQLFKIS